MMIALMISISLTFVSGFDYCSITCQGQQHTLCVYREGGSDACRGYKGGLTPEEQEMVLKIHNGLRRKVALGKWAQPPAADMMELIWDDELATIAQRWVDQCTLRGHDPCRETRDRGYVGQNVAYGSHPGFSRAHVIKDLLMSFFNEVKGVSPSTVDHFNPNGSSLITHYTQFVWAKTTHVGCGMSVNDDHSSDRLACNYRPGGNVVTKPIYHRGKPCSSCPQGSVCSWEYPGLCKSRHAYYIPPKYNFPRRG